MPTYRASTKPEFRGSDFVMFRQDRRPPPAQSSEMLCMAAIIGDLAVRGTTSYQGRLGEGKYVCHEEMARDIPYEEETEMVVRC